MTHIPGQWSPQWAKAEESYWRSYCRNAGECYYCGERDGKHEDGCRNAPAQDEEDGDECDF